MNKKAILVVSFGTSHDDTREATLDVIESRVKERYPDHGFYSAWTSKRIIKKLADRDGIRINTVNDAFEQMIADGVKEVVVQPTYVLNGFENEIMIRAALPFKEKLDRLVFSKPLLTSQKDIDFFIEMIKKEFSFLKEDEALVLMGHGTEHYANTAYAALDYAFKEKGLANVFVGTIEAYPTLDTARKLLKEFKPSNVYLAPLLIVAGDHAKNDMAGDGEDSWKSILESDGYEVECIVKGLGEYDEVRDLFMEHLDSAVRVSAL